jgi:hypothetical protein
MFCSIAICFPEEMLNKNCHTMSLLPSTTKQGTVTRGKRTGIAGASIKT